MASEILWYMIHDYWAVSMQVSQSTGMMFIPGQLNVFLPHSPKGLYDIVVSYVDGRVGSRVDKTKLVLSRLYFLFDDFQTWHGHLLF